MKKLITICAVVGMILAVSDLTQAGMVITLDGYGNGTYSIDGGASGALPYLGVVAPNLYGMPGHATACYGLSDSGLWINPAMGDLVIRESATPVNPTYYSSTTYPGPYSNILRFGYYQTNNWVPGYSDEYGDYPGYFEEVPAVFVYSADTGLPAVWTTYGGYPLYGTVIAREGNDGTATYTPWKVTDGYGLTAGGDSNFGATPGNNFGTLTYNFVPEPATIAILSLGGLLLGRKK
ncbi:MAG: PEP-CTERM sorting domain-containing protein [Sedimentisphaerales bacterium]